MVQLLADLKSINKRGESLRIVSVYVPDLMGAVSPSGHAQYILWSTSPPMSQKETLHILAEISHTSGRFDHPFHSHVEVM